MCAHLPWPASTSSVRGEQEDTEAGGGERAPTRCLSCCIQGSQSPVQVPNLLQGEINKIHLGPGWQCIMIQNYELSASAPEWPESGKTYKKSEKAPSSVLGNGKQVAAVAMKLQPLCLPSTQRKDAKKLRVTGIPAMSTLIRCFDTADYWFIS